MGGYALRTVHATTSIHPTLRRPMTYASLPPIQYFLIASFLFFFQLLSPMQSLYSSISWRLLAASAVFIIHHPASKELHKLHL